MLFQSCRLHLFDYFFRLSVKLRKRSNVLINESQKVYFFEIKSKLSERTKTVIMLAKFIVFFNNTHMAELNFKEIEGVVTSMLDTVSSMAPIEGHSNQSQSKCCKQCIINAL